VTETALRSIAVLTTGRQDWGVLHSTCVALREHPGIELRLVAGGMHLAARHGLTVDLIREDGFEPDAEIDWLAADVDPPADVQAAAALGLVGEWLRNERPDALLTVGDRLETASAALAATLSRIPIAHLHGGEQTLGAFDDQLRHAITKLSHIHLVSHDEHRRRVIALGEDPDTVHVVGAPGLDAAVRTDLPDRAALERELGMELRSPVVIVTVHPATLDADPARVAAAVAAAMDRVDATYVVTLPNADPGGEQVRRILINATSAMGRQAVEALGERRYWGLMRIADAMLGNSSSGLVEAPAVDLPAVNVGDRQLGRRREANVIDAPADPDRIVEALRTALEPETRRRIAERHPPLADGRAGRRVADIIAGWRPSIPPRKAPIDVST
jgi:UDP-hydrolysing UDP-N-acetyl-D-glucosamine 2-epimerase